MEILRLLAMFFVLILHANMGMNPWPIGNECIVSNPTLSFLRLLVEAGAIIAVNALFCSQDGSGFHFRIKKCFPLSSKFFFSPVSLSLFRASKELVLPVLLSRN